MLDTGTANEENLRDPLYLGLRTKRIPVSEQQDLMDEFMAAAADVYPNMVVQFEDFESEKAFNYLDRYRNKYKCFNDDIQGTGAVVLAGYVYSISFLISSWGFSPDPRPRPARRAVCETNKPLRTEQERECGENPRRNASEA